MASRRKKIWVRIILGLLGLLSIVGILFYVYFYPVLKAMMTVKEVQYDKELSLVLGGGGNSGILVSDSIVLVIDTKMFGDAPKDLHDKAKALAGNKPIVVINTHDHPDHAKGNKLYKGSTIIAGGNYDKEKWKKDNGEEGMPTIWVKDSMIINMGTEKVVILNLNRNAHTISDMVVYLQNRKILFAGDLILNKLSPVLMAENHSDVDGYLADFDMLQKRFDIITIVPGHGAEGGIEVLNTFRQYLQDMKTAANDDSQKAAMLAKYDSWLTLPFMMSPAKTVSYIKESKKAQ